MNIPIYRAKKLDSAKYVEGYLLPSLISNAMHRILVDNGSIYFVDDLTLAINFPNMIDSEGIKIFASLSDNGKGGDIVEFEHIRYLEDDEPSYMIKGLCIFIDSSFLVEDIDNKFDRVFYYEEGRIFSNKELRVIGIQE